MIGQHYNNCKATQAHVAVDRIAPKIYGSFPRKYLLSISGPSVTKFIPAELRMPQNLSVRKENFD